MKNLLFLGFGAVLCAQCALADVECAEGATCTVELPGSECGDGTQSFVRVTRRPGAENLFIFLNGGGACWDRGTCGCDASGVCKGGTASAGLTRQDPAAYGNWDTGEGWANSADAQNPVAKFNVIEVPYCTGDVYSGNNVANYGSQTKPALVRHKGYNQVKLMFEAARRLFPNPEKVVFMGCSAGGLGVTFNVHQLRDAYPGSKSYVISDSGLPFKAPHLKAMKIKNVLSKWGSEQNFQGVNPGVDGVLDVGDIVRYNGEKFPESRFALISTYGDTVMKFFATLVGTLTPTTAVTDIMMDVADNDMNPLAQKPFYLEGTQHCFYGDAPGDVQSEGVSLAAFAQKMIGDDPDWQAVRPR